MRTHIKLGLQMFRNTSAFLMNDAVVRASLGSIAREVIVLDGVIERLHALAVEQDECDRRYHDAVQQVARHTHVLMQKYVRPLVRVGQTLFRANSRRGAAFRVSLAKNGRHEAMIAVAEEIADHAVERWATFIEAGFEADFIERLYDAIEALRESLELKAEFHGRRSAATAELYPEFSRGRRVVRVLDALVAPQLEGTDRLIEWKMISQFAEAVSGEAEEGSNSETRSSAA